MNNSKIVLEEYRDSNKLKDEIVNNNYKRPVSKAEQIFLQSIVAIGVDSEHDNKYDVGKIIRILYEGDATNEEDLSIVNNIIRLESSIGRLNNQVDTLTNFYFDNVSLRKKIRKGHILWDSKSERLESVAEHVYGTCCLALSIYNNMFPDIDIEKVLKMLTIHETEEIIMGDLSEFEINENDKLALGNECCENTLLKLKKKDKYLELLKDFNEKQTKEAKFAYLCDKLEYLLQVKLYEEKGCYDFDNRPNNCATNSTKVLNIINSGADSVFRVHALYDEHRFMDDEIFKYLFDELSREELNVQLKLAI